MAASDTGSESAPDAKPFTDLSGFHRDVLGVLARERTAYGLGMKRALETIYGEDITHGRLYSNLDHLVENDLVEKGEIDGRTNSYELTQQGQAELETYHSWLATCLE